MAFTADLALGHEARLAQHTQMLGNGWPADGKGRAELLDGKIAVGEQDKQLAASRISNRAKRINGWR